MTPQDIIPLVNEAWKVSFARVGDNLKAISERGWGPLNRNLLLYKDIQNSMNRYEGVCFNERYNLPSTPLHSIIIPNSTKNSESTVSDFTPQHLQDKQMKPSLNPNIQKKKVIELNFTHGNSAMVLESLISFQDLQGARERIKQNKRKGEEVNQKISFVDSNVSF